MIKYHQITDSKYDQQIRELYELNNNQMGVHPVFTKGILDNELSVPSDYYTANGRYLIVAVEESQDRVVGLMCVAIIAPDDDTLEYSPDSTCRFYELSNLSIHSDYRRQGIGTEMIRLAREKGAVHLSCLGTNSPALQFYDSLDFVSKSEEHRHSVRTNVDYTLVHYVFKML